MHGGGGGGGGGGGTTHNLPVFPGAVYHTHAPPPVEHNRYNTVGSIERVTRDAGIHWAYHNTYVRRPRFPSISVDFRRVVDESTS